jgi:hypothetical protein
MQFFLNYLMGLGFGLSSLVVAKLAAKVLINRDKKRRLLSDGSATVQHDNQKG